MTASAEYEVAAPQSDGSVRGILADRDLAGEWVVMAFWLSGADGGRSMCAVPWRRRGREYETRRFADRAAIDRWAVSWLYPGRAER